MKIRSTRFYLFSLVACLLLLFTSCTELAVNPLLFDGTPVSGDFSVSTSGSSYADSATIFLADIMSEIDKSVDSLSVINVTLLIDSIKSPTLGSTTISGTGSIDGINLMTLTNVPLSTFALERSIFDPALLSLGCTFNQAGVTYIDNILKHPESLPTSVIIRFSGSSSSSGLYFQAHLKLYTQVFTTI